VYSALRSFHSH